MNYKNLKRLVSTSIASVVLTLALPGSAQTIQTVAGGGNGDGGSAKSAILPDPRAAFADSTGNLYIIDGNRIRKVDPNGIITTIAGSGTPGFGGDGGPATNATLAFPQGLALDNANNLYIADTGNHRIRKVDVNGLISTVAGTGTLGFSGDGGPATNAGLTSPFGVALDSAGNLYIADSSNHRIRKVNTSGVISTVAGTGNNSFGGDGGQATAAALKDPRSVALDGSGNIYIADTSNERIRKVNSGGVISTIAGTGTFGFNGDAIAATNALLAQPIAVAVDGAGNLYIADKSNRRIRKVGTDGVISTVAGGGTCCSPGEGILATSALMGDIAGMAIGPDGSLLIADPGYMLIRKVDASGFISTLAGNGGAKFSGEGAVATSATLNVPQGIAVDNAGNLYIADKDNYRIRKVSNSGIITTVAGNGIAGFSGDNGFATAAQLKSPFGVAVDSAGNLYIADAFNNRIRKVSANGLISTVAGNGARDFSGDGGAATGAALAAPTGVAIDGAGNLFIADAGNSRIRKVNTSGIISTVAGNGDALYSGDGGAATAAGLHPTSVTVDGANNLYITDNGNSRIRKVDTNGVITSVAGNSTLNFSGDGGPAASAALYDPKTVAVDNVGNLYIADRGNLRIRRINASGIISSVAGTGTFGTTGDGGPATSAQLSSPYGVAVDSAGNLYLSDADRIRKVTFSNLPGPPVMGTAAAGAAQISVTFTPGPDSGSPILDYTATCTSLSPSGSFNAVGTASPLVVTGLTNGVAYTCRVVARNANGTSAASAASNSVTPASGNLVLNINRAGTGFGTVSSTAPDTDCGSICSATVGNGATITLIAAVVPGSVFAGWSGVTCSAGNSSPTCSFTVAANVTVTATFNTSGAPGPAFPDFNADTKPDLIWTNTISGATYIWRMNGASLLAESLLATIDPIWKIQGVADFNGDGHPDVIYRNTSTGDTYVWYLVNGVFQSDAFVFSLPPEWVIQGVADFNKDGKPDFLMRNTVSGNAFVWFFNNANAIGDQFLFNIDPSWKVEGVADLNADGQPDLLFRNMVSGLSFAWNSQYQGGVLSLTTSSPPIFSIDPAWEVVQVADWNADGKPDLVFRNLNTGVVFVWYLNGTTLTTSDFITQIDPSWEIVPRR